MSATYTNDFIVEPTDLNPDQFCMGDIAIIRGEAHVLGEDSLGDARWLRIADQPRTLNDSTKRRFREMANADTSAAFVLADVAAHIAVLEYRLQKVLDAAKPAGG